MTKKSIVIFLATFLVFFALLSCKKRVEIKPPAPPSQKAEEKAMPVEEVKEAPAVAKPELSEEEIFKAKTLEELNREKPLQMIHFDFDKYDIREDAKPILEKNAEWLRRHPTVKILIEGHCDERGTEEYNLALGEKRAKATMEYLVALGISPNRIKIISYGKSRPLDPGHNEIAWAKNRRAEFVIIAK
ncbi:peptidoglycan-associated lipoprotein Pal [Candidatus Aminicenantes bacterium AC-708-M15]|jgi:peptidoglycan-associated lipoprotein|nr:peptidoglycan-associated lipoprotein Pal [SCandidatus Aminicenantes bacterium Aminicenantia_JdfR_composite]MCP2597952.1 peptidoglycan-associated lipoprotein Pal [Candidatus Aminicenantes bacterium AC-335-L06]MCP2604518.1 peptidoglycan-associated lipoprotein Pal [Candidatus Aminicenantes bacterium AC-708-M15]MCP2618528.1 peptidoglycan-associated lipoprotein Pal [Candidatus Aminicenantes bacterium AC-335-A11]